MKRYRDQLARDLPRWRAAGWVTPDGEAAILKDALQSSAGGIGMASVLAILAAVLLGFAIMTFVASNWQEMGNSARLAILFGCVAAAYAAAAELFRRGMDGFGNAALLAGVAAFGASIMLIGQMYHLGGYPPHAVLMWAIAAFVTGLLVRSNATLALAMILVALWGGWETSLSDKVYWPALIGWAVVSAAYYVQRWWPGVHLSGLALTAFVVHAALSNDGPRYEGTALVGYTHGTWWLVQLGLAAAVLGAFGHRAVPWLSKIGPALIGYGLVLTFCGLFYDQFLGVLIGSHYSGPISFSQFVPVALFTLAIAIAAVIWGLRSENRGLVWIGYTAFSIEILGLYFRTIGTLLSTSAFFLSAAVLVAILAAVAYRLHARQGEMGATA
jgi:uncharacterized membrane protein